MNDLRDRPGLGFALALLALFAGGSGCAATRPVVVVDRTPHLSLLADEPFTFIAGSANQTPVEAPVISVEIADHSAALVVDLGSGKATLSPALTSALGSRPGPLDPADGQASLPISIGQQRGKTPWTTAAIDPSLEAAGASGKLDPALLLARGYIVLDLSHTRILLVDATPALLRDWLKVRFGGLTFAEVPIRGAGPAIFVDASLEDAPVLQARLDTAGARTTFPTSYAGASTRASTPPAKTTSSPNAPTMVKKELTGRTLRFAGRAFGPVSILAATNTAPGAPPIEPVLGLDMLSGAVLVVPIDRKEPLLVAVP